jgi:periplasmic protein TonB
VKTSLRCGGCLFGALLISAALHLVLAGTLLWPGSGQVPDDPGVEEVGVSLAMFTDLGPPQASVQASAREEAVTHESDPQPVQEQVVDEPEPPPEPAPLAEARPEPTPQPSPQKDRHVPDSPPTVAAPTPEREAHPIPKPVPKATVKPKPKRVKPSKIVKATKATKATKAKPTQTRRRLAASKDGAKQGGSGTSGAAGAAVERGYLRGLQQAIARNRFYPPGARRKDLKGMVTVAFTIKRDGRLGDIRVTKGSGYDVLDQAALETLRRLGRYKPIPTTTGRDQWPVRVPIVFDLR